MERKGTAKTGESYVPDSSVLIEGLVSEMIEKKEIQGTIILPAATLAELEHQANNDSPSGYLGIDEIKKLKELEEKKKIILNYSGRRPSPLDIKNANKGEIDNLIREVAAENNATLITADKVQHEITNAMGIKSILKVFEKNVETISIEKFFDETTMSVHLRDNTTPKAKKGKPGEWKFEEISKNKLTTNEIKDYAKEITEKANMDPNSFIEIEKRGSSIVQFRNYRIVMTHPPLSDGWEITAVRPVKILTLDDYHINEKLHTRLEKQAEGILVAGAPGNGKSTFCQALGIFYLKNNKIVKTVEAPRDLILPPEITQYSKNVGTNEEIHDILLLSRPDYTIFDEIRNTDDFELFKDLRLSGVGMVGVVHATNPIDAIQRFIGRVELGMVPSIIDTVIFIDKGQIGRVLEINITVRVPSGMTEADLARPIVEVKDFMTGELAYEMYTFGEQTVVIPVKDMPKHSVARNIAKDVLKEKVMKELPKNTPFKISMPSENTIEIQVPKDKIAGIIGRKGANIGQLEKKIGVNIQVRELTGEDSGQEDYNNESDSADYTIKEGRRSVEIILNPRMEGKNVEIFSEGKLILSGSVSRKGSIKLNKKTSEAQKLIQLKNLGKKLQVRV
ncbi:ATPase [archaeon CG_4_10_14_0_2_um_filter_Archaea_38_6]|nr:MAG: ATPase [archaeon CG07_land_8_20_14_0_80_38_8]PIU89581.1 MAG: ATPase [archaeon CG06_land_8_20_14_3_00_37_11]PJA21682.1 MAG: ATPase [archaeon CG_4_10_14_0_2_um_filter_Archaea_38_6]